MARFLTTLEVRYDGKDRILTAPLKYESDIAGSIVVPEGFRTDFASVPRVPLLYLLFGNTAHEAAVIHDYLYRYAIVPRRTADRVFREAMNASGVWAWRRYPMYMGVRMFGGFCYDD